MNISVSGQTMEFLYAALFGVALGVLYDIFAILRSYLPAKKMFAALFDVLFWIIAIVALLAFVMLVTGGRMRWYVLVGSFLGIFLYKSTISALFFRSIRIIISVCIKILHLSVRPLYLLSAWLYHIAQRAWRGSCNMMRKKRAKSRTKKLEKNERKQKRRYAKRGKQKKKA